MGKGKDYEFVGSSLVCFGSIGLSSWAVNDCVVVQLNQFLQLSVTRDGLSSSCSSVKDRRLSFQFKFGFGFGFGERYKILRSNSVSVRGAMYYPPVLLSVWANLRPQYLGLRVDLFPRSIQVRVVVLPLVRYLQM